MTEADEAVVDTFSFDGEDIYQMYDMSGAFVRTADYLRLQKRIQDQRAELARLQPIAEWYSHHWAQSPDASLAIEELKNIIRARRHDSDHFANDTEFAEWAIARARYTLALIDSATPTPSVDPAPVVTDLTAAQTSLNAGRRDPYHGRPPVDWAENAALGVLADLLDRRNIKHALVDKDCEPDEDQAIRSELVCALADIIRTAEQRRQCANV